MTWNSVGNPYYPPNSDPHVAYTHEADNWIRWDVPASGVSLYASCYDGSGNTYYYSAYDAVGTLLEQITTLGGPNFLVTFTANNISELVVTGTGDWNTHHTIDDLAYSDGGGGLEVVLSGYPASVEPGDVLAFDADAVNNGVDPAAFDQAVMDVTGPALLTKTLYAGPDVTVAGGSSIGTTVSLNVPLIAPLGTYNVEVSIFDDGVLIDADDFDVAVAVPGAVTIDFDDLVSGSPIGAYYAGVEFSPGWMTWDSVGNPYYPPNSVPNTAYTHEIDNWIEWNTPVKGLSVYASCYDGDGDTYYYSVYDAGGVLLEEINTLGGPNFPVTFTAVGISKLVVSGTGSWTTHHTIDDLSYTQ